MCRPSGFDRIHLAGQGNRIRCETGDGPLYEKVDRTTHRDQGKMSIRKFSDLQEISNPNQGSYGSDSRVNSMDENSTRPAAIARNAADKREFTTSASVAAEGYEGDNTDLREYTDLEVRLPRTVKDRDGSLYEITITHNNEQQTGCSMANDEKKASRVNSHARKYEDNKPQTEFDKKEPFAVGDIKNSKNSKNKVTIGPRGEHNTSRQTRQNKNQDRREKQRDANPEYSCGTAKSQPKYDILVHLVLGVGGK